MSRLLPIIVRHSIHPVYHGGQCVLISGGPFLHVSRLLPIIVRESIHPVYHGGHCVCVCVYVCVCLPLPAPPTTHCVLPMFIAQLFHKQGRTPTCVKIVSDHCLRLHPPCVSRGSLCVCVCVFVCVGNRLLLLLHTAYSRCT